MHRLIPLVFSLLLATAAIAAETTPQRHVLLDVEIRELTLEGVSRRLELLRSAPGDIEAQAALDAEIQSRIDEALASYDTDINAHLHYYQANRDAIAAWLEQQPAVTEHIERMQARLLELSDQISSLVGTPRTER